MELKLYNYLRKEGLTHPDVDFRESVYQDRLEQYDTTLGLDNTILNSVEKHLKTYNTYLKTTQQEEVSLRYYQILALYFTELYLNIQDDHDFPYRKKELKGLAYWMATGSGKTIIMHLNILQYIAHCKSFRDFEIIMTTPGVNLIEQHERELTPFLEFLNSLNVALLPYFGEFPTTKPPAEISRLPFTVDKALPKSIPLFKNTVVFASKLTVPPLVIFI